VRGKGTISELSRFKKSPRGEGLSGILEKKFQNTGFCELEEEIKSEKKVSRGGEDRRGADSLGPDTYAQGWKQKEKKTNSQENPTIRYFCHRRKREIKRHDWRGGEVTLLATISSRCLQQTIEGSSYLSREV